MGDVGDFWNDMKPVLKEQSQKKRQRNKEFSTNLLIEKGIEFDSKNEGIHLIVHGKNSIIDFWPTTGKYISRCGKKGRGIFNLLKLC